MGVTKKPSGVNIIGLGAADLNEFKPVDQLKDLYIQLTANGATNESMDYLAYLKSYAEHNQSIGLPIMPNGVNVWISNNGKTSAVEADDLSLEDGVYTICGIKCEDGEWDFTNAGQHSGGGGSDLPEVDDADNGKVLTVIDGAWAAGSGGGGGGGALIVKCTGTAVLETQGNNAYWNIPVDTSFADIFAAMRSGPVYISLPFVSTTEPYYHYENDYTVMLPVLVFHAAEGVYGGSVLLPQNVVPIGQIAVVSITFTKYDNIETLEIYGNTN